MIKKTRVRIGQRVTVIESILSSETMQISSRAWPLRVLLFIGMILRREILYIYIYTRRARGIPLIH